VISFDREFVGDDEAVPLSSSTVGFVVTERLSGCIKGVDECIRFANGNKLGDDVRDSFRFPLSIDNGDGDSLRVDNDVCSTVLKFDIEEDGDDCFEVVLR
jgi:hypothetical protein